MSVAGWQAALRASLLTPNGPWQQVDALATVDSTNAESLRDPRPWRLVAAGEQTAGRGRRSRSWQSPAGTSVALSATVPLAAVPDVLGWFPLLTGLAVRDALAALTGSPDGFVLKWPNDVLARTDSAGLPWGKVCGVLCDVVGSLVVAGVGVNVTVPRSHLPVPTATSLQLCGHSVSRRAIAIGVARALADVHAGWVAGSTDLDRLTGSYRRWCQTIGTDVTVSTPDGRVRRGVARNLDSQGRLVFESPGGISLVAAADVVHLRPRVTQVDDARGTPPTGA
ncbi:MAG TPA: biotin--[acetyl-CoA-carboxylase] ligase [Dermatophilaceae bacterium]|nr:biotin--[acetyl-CoA-carboxylase] ligase [Dermatophilaceae bacterium]